MAVLTVATTCGRADSGIGLGNSTRKTSEESGIAGVQIDADANALIQDWCNGKGAIKRSVLSKIVRWWLKTRESFQLATMGQVPPELSEEFAKALEEYARHIREKIAQRAKDMELAKTGVDEDTPTQQIPPTEKLAADENEQRKAPRGGRPGTGRR